MALRSSISAAFKFPFATYCSASLTEALESFAYAVGHANSAMAEAKTIECHERLRPRGIAFPFSQARSRIEDDLMLLHQVIKSGPADPKQLCRFRQVGAGLGKSELQNFTLGAGARGPQSQRLGLLSLLRKTEIEGGEQSAVGHYDRSFHTIFQLTHIAWPGFFFFQAEDGIRDLYVTEFRRVLFR